MTNKSHNTLCALVQSSQPADVAVWERVLKFLSERQCIKLVEVMRADTTMIQALTDLLKRKMKTLASRNHDEWKNIIASEIDLLNKKLQNI